MSSPANDPAFTSWPRSPKRLHQIDPGLALADMFDPAIARRLWDSLPEECRSDHFDKKTMPAHYRPAIREVSAGSSSGSDWTACYLNFRGLPEPMTWEVAWIIHRYIELGRFIRIVDANAVFILLRAAIPPRGRRMSVGAIAAAPFARRVGAIRAEGADARREDR